MKNFNRFLFLFSVLLNATFLFSQQTWVEMMADPTVNFYDVRQSFNQYWAGKDSSEKGKGWKPFKRWEWFTEQRVYPSGDRSIMNIAMGQYFDQVKNSPESPNGNWAFLGPTNVPTNGGGAGRCNFVRFDPNNNNTVYTGSPGGGLWKSTNSGSSWTNWNTDNLPVIGCSDLAIDPTNTNVMYLATGDGDASDTYSIGVLKSTDGGINWNTTGLNWTVNQGRVIRRLIVNPSNTNILIAATSNGIYRTTNGGTAWTQVQTGSFYDAEFKPGDPNTVYATTDQFYKSTDGGATWTQITAGVPAANLVNRLAIGVTPANANYVYILASLQSNSGFQGMYRSTNSGTNFTTQSTSPNIMGWDNGGDSGGQGWYDLSIAISPTNANEVFTGGVNVWRSTDGGVNWVLNAHWYGGFSKPYVHADIHDLIFVPGSGTTVWVGSDGGIFRTTNNGTSYTDLSNGLQIGQMYRLGTSATNANLNLTGWQDNGTNRLSSGAWARVIGGDGMECIIDHSNANTMYGELYYGNIRKSTNGGASFATIVNSGGAGVHGNGNWVTPYVMHPSNAQTLLVGKSGLYRTIDGGTNWTTLGAIAGSGNVCAIAYAPSNPNIIYVARTNTIHVSTNGGTSFTNITTGLPNLNITYIAVSNTDPNKVYVTYSGYTAASKVYMSTNGGTSWTNYSTGLPNLPVNCIVYENNSSDGVYVGTDVGVYYRNSGLGSWTSFSNNLPNVIVDELEIQYSSQKVRAATFGRGLWESDLYSPPQQPVANFSANPTSVCAGGTVQFTDLSTNAPTSWSWTFPGGTPGTSTQQNPLITYNTPGTYNATLVATNIYGSSTETKNAYITVNPIPVATATPNSQTFCSGGTTNIALTSNVGGTTFAWTVTQSGVSGASNGSGSTISQTLTATGGTNGTATYTITPTANGCAGTPITVVVTVKPNPVATATPPDDSICSGETVNINLSSNVGGTSFAWTVTQTNVTGASNGNGSVISQTLNTVMQSSGTAVYTATPTANACVGSPITITVVVSPIPIVSVIPPSHEMCEKDTVQLVASGASAYTWLPGTGLSNTSGDTVFAFPTTSITYTVNGTSIEGCVGSATVVITVYPLPLMPTITQSGNVLTCNPAYASYQWYLNSILIPGATSQSYTITQSGNYMVEVTDTNGCHNSSDVFDAILDASNVKENAVFSNLKIYPNPNNGEFTFSGFLNLPGEYKLEIKNTLGQVIYSDLLQQQNGNINETVHLKNVGSGVYMLMIKANNQSAVYRIVVH
ncbi:Xyloglucanase Xgh74A [Flavobacteriales bacterium]|nr:Xyloglucanase Xgh74A [Flavobacteriales bacterium]